MGQKVSAISALVLKAIALAMGVAVVILNIVGTSTGDTSITLLGIGLLAIALAALTGGKEPE